MHNSLFWTASRLFTGDTFTEQNMFAERIEAGAELVHFWVNDLIE